MKMTISQTANLSAPHFPALNEHAALRFAVLFLFYFAQGRPFVRHARCLCGWTGR